MASDSERKWHQILSEWQNFSSSSYTNTIGLSSLRVSLQSVSNSAASYKKNRPGVIRPYLLIVERIVDGVAQSRDEVGLWYQRHTLLDQKLCLGKHAGKKAQKTEAEENQRLDSKFLRGNTIKVNIEHSHWRAGFTSSPLQRQTMMRAKWSADKQINHQKSLSS